MCNAWGIKEPIMVRALEDNWFLIEFRSKSLCGEWSSMEA
jgi:hypothetical protein